MSLDKPSRYEFHWSKTSLCVQMAIRWKSFWYTVVFLKCRPVNDNSLRDFIQVNISQLGLTCWILNLPTPKLVSFNVIRPSVRKMCKRNWKPAKLCAEMRRKIHVCYNFTAKWYFGPSVEAIIVTAYVNTLHTTVRHIFDDKVRK
jgi:hypothetical protein